MRYIFYPYKVGSRSCKDLCAYLNAKGYRTLRVLPDGRYRYRVGDVVINWGNANAPNWQAPTILNKPLNVSKAVNKLDTFEILKAAEVRTVPFTTDIQVANTWDRVVERHMLRAHSGEGIRLAERNDLRFAPLYTQLLAPAEEYRVHVFKGVVIDYSKKMKRVNGEMISTNEEVIKNKGAGWDFVRDVAPRQGVCDRAIAAVAALGLDFGAVDVIRHDNKSYVLEVGTACGLSPRGVEAYCSKLIEHVNGI